VATLVNVFLKYVKENSNQEANTFFPMSTGPKLHQGCIKWFGGNAFYH